ncbi:hypothetical protein [Rickettsia endosymbiont of Orchestes rusci]
MRGSKSPIIARRDVVPTWQSSKKYYEIYYFLDCRAPFSRSQ